MAVASDPAGHVNGWLTRAVAVWLMLMFSIGSVFIAWAYVVDHQMFMAAEFESAWTFVKIAVAGLAGWFAHKLAGN